MKTFLTFLAAVIVGATVTAAVAGPIKTWSGSDTMNASDMNANFSHIHGTMVGGHGARLVDADVSGSAAIAHSKLATPALVPKLWGAIGAAACGATPCTLVDSSTISTITRSGAGVYSANFSARANADYGAIVTSHISTVACYVTTRTTTTAAVLCFDSATGATPTDSSFTFMMLDANN